MNILFAIRIDFEIYRLQIDKTDQCIADLLLNSNLNHRSTALSSICVELVIRQNVFCFSLSFEIEQNVLLIRIVLFVFLQFGFRCDVFRHFPRFYFVNNNVKAITISKHRSQFFRSEVVSENYYAEVITIKNTSN